MQIHILLIYYGFQNEIERKGNFKVDNMRFNKNPSMAVAEVTLKWIRFRKEGSVSRIIKTVYNGYMILLI